MFNNLLLFSSLLSLVGLYKFTTAFFLAKKSMPHISTCEPDSARNLLYDVLELGKENIDKIESLGILSKHHLILGDKKVGHENSRKAEDDIQAQGCWMPRRVDAVALIVVDALRFDFALEHLPKSIGKRLLLEQERISRRQDSVKNDEMWSNDKRRDESWIEVDDVPPLGQSQLYQFVADPPTVTMQRLKGLTTGGLPTFADISGSFGGATVDEDSWVQQLHDVPSSRRGIFSAVGSKGTGNEELKEDNETDGRQSLVKMAFVGDDTWVDLFPTQFDDSHPFPSFNTRDLDTVDDGCLLHLPRLLDSFGRSARGPRKQNDEKDTSPYFEMLVTHFLGVDHVGHTYGPHNVHMDAKLNQIDDALETIFNKIDQANEVCQVVFVFGDHGMTEDGNHGGGTSEEINAALFAHYSPGCGDMGPSLDITGSEVGEHSEDAFRSINQIDLVPTISFLLGLPIPYANLGGVVPALLPPLYHKFNHTEKQLVEAPFVATALALNAAQVWNYLATYSVTANKLPEENMSELKAILDQGTLAFKNALLQQGGYDSIAFREACGQYKYFLSRAIALGKQVWTRFDTSGMLMGILIMLVALVLQIPWLTVTVKTENSIVATKQSRKSISVVTAKQNGQDSKVLGRKSMLETLVLVMILFFHCFLLTFSNSYIISEQNIVMFMLSIVCLIPIIFSLLWDIENDYPFSTASLLLTIMISSRANELFIKGHGLDPMIRKHWAHNCPVFLTSLCILAVMRLLYFSRKRMQNGIVHVVMDTTAIISLCISWYEKRSPEVSRHGYLSSRFSLSICFIGFCKCLLDEYRLANLRRSSKTDSETDMMHRFNILLIKVLIFTITVTGPSSASSSILFICQCWAIYYLIARNKNVTKIRAPTLAMIWRLCIRHAFFATGHACSFNRLQFSAAFVAFETFRFGPAGLSLFLNTFGWDILGICYLSNVCKANRRQDILSWFCFFQLLETTISCISVSILRRHLMVWAIFAPRFVFSAIFLFLCNSYHSFHIMPFPKRPSVQDHLHKN
mmetsp:Transcript_2205/g.4051  ORF Transcript_2205/g.4051 Transcript_2205/m.4051 type:complete len:1023 (+) Transcript_2205:286-3354(+)